MPVDYSKFDKIEDSDDEAPSQAKKATAKAAPPVAKPTCPNCSKDLTKPLICSRCKKVSYCSAQCQKEDWQFHKRNCQKPPEPKAKPQARPKEERPPEPRRPKEDEKVVDNDDNITWYKHREWKPSAEPKKEFTPQQIDAGEAVAAAAGAEQPSGAGSVWNAAGTWEDKDVTAMAKSRLASHFEAVASVEVAGGTLEVSGVDAVEGDASKPVIRGTRRHIFDVSFEVKFVFKWMDSGGQRKAEGTVKVCDFTNDAYTDGGNAPVLQPSFKDSKLLDGGRRQAVEEALGASSWPAPAGTLMANVAGRMQAFSNEFQELA